MAVSAEILASAVVSETGASGLDLVSESMVHRLALASTTLNAASTPAATQVWSDRASLTAGAATIDLTALARANLSALDLTGLKVQVILIRNLSTNTGTLEIDVGAANGYNILGSATSEAVLPVGGFLFAYLPEGTPDVSGTASDIDLVSADTDATYDVLIVAG
jgi:hypothetical protein